MSALVICKVAVHLPAPTSSPSGTGKLVQALLDRRLPPHQLRLSGITGLEVVATRSQAAGEQWVPVADVLESNVIPAAAADVVRAAVAKARARGGIGAGPAWQLLELLAADYLAAG